MGKLSILDKWRDTKKWEKRIKELEEESKKFDIKMDRDRLFKALDCFLSFYKLGDRLPPNMKEYFDFEVDEICRKFEIKLSVSKNIASEYALAESSKKVIRNVIYEDNISDGEKEYEQCKCIIDCLHTTSVKLANGMRSNYSENDFRIELQYRKEKNNDQNATWKVAKAYGPKLLSEINGRHYWGCPEYPESDPQLLSDLPN